jgi:hypothetical protein
MFKAVVVILSIFFPSLTYAEGTDWHFHYLGDVEGLEGGPGVYQVESTEFRPDLGKCFVTIRELDEVEIALGSYEGYASEEPDGIMTWFEVPNQTDLIPFPEWAAQTTCPQINELPKSGELLLFIRYT